jgi:hypothetical protein
MNRCAATVHWHELDLDRRCIRTEGHTGLHRDGVWWFDNLGMRVPRADEHGDRTEQIAREVLPQ